MRLSILLIIFYSFTGQNPVLGQSGELQRLYAQAIEAQRNGDNKGFYDLIIQAHKIHPYHQGILYQAGIAAALNNKNTEAVAYLKEAILIRSDFVLDIPELNSLKGNKDFESLKILQKELSKEVIGSDTAFVVKDKTLHVESVTPGEDEGIFYIGSIHKRKIVKVNKDKTLSDFTNSKQDGLCAVFDVKVDQRKKYLWASSSPMPEMEGYQDDLPSGVFQYDIKSYKLVRKFLPENPKLDLVLGSIAINKKGEVFASDSKSNLLFKVNESTGKLEQFFSSEEFWNVQGITFSDDNKYMFIADYIKGIFRLNLTNFDLLLLPKNFDPSLKSIDGLVFFNNSLIAIQNGLKPMRVTRYALTKNMDKLEAYSILDQGHPAFNEPTLGTLDKNTFYYVANSLWSGYDDNHNLKPDTQLQEVIILKTNLKQ